MQAEIQDHLQLQVHAVQNNFVYNWVHALYIHLSQIALNPQIRKQAFASPVRLRLINNRTI